MNIDHFHFHIYFEKEQLDQAQNLVQKLKLFDGIEIGRVWQEPIGPHPIGSCQITVKDRDFLKMTQWFLQNRKGLDLFVHAVTGDDVIDHTQYVMWIGKSHDLNLDFFNVLK